MDADVLALFTEATFAAAVDAQQQDRPSLDEAWERATRAATGVSRAGAPAVSTGPWPGVQRAAPGRIVGRI